MNIYPILIDSRPSYLVNSSTTTSLLLVPLGTGTLGGHLRSRLAAVTNLRPLVLADFDPDPEYEAAIGRACPSVEAVMGWPDFTARLANFEPSDWLLVSDPRYFPADGFQPESLLRYSAADPRWVRHLVALETSSLGTRECLEFGADGRVRRIQRYYESVTWPFTSGVACSLLPAACAFRAGSLSFVSLSELRRELAARGVPSRDLPLPGGVFDLTQEAGLLALSERFVHEAASGNGDGASTGRVAHAGRRCQIHPTARIMGPVVLHEDVVLEEDATILGPSLVGTGARVGRNAVVAQSLIGPGIVIPPDFAVRHRAVFEQLSGDVPAVRDSAALVYRGPAAAQGVALPSARRVRSIYPKVKAVAEAILAFAGLVVLSPLLLLIAALVKLESRGPFLYGHKREGKDGHVFWCWKFRTMFEGADAKQRELYGQSQVDGPQFKLDNDPRITRVGSWLRPMSLDELPQLINVVKGEMSLVGPRPSPFRENQMCVPWREGRLSVRPGITGLWQVCRHHRSTGDFHQWIDHDLLYVRHLSLWLDLKILIATVVSLGGKKHVPLPWILSPESLQEDR